MSFQIIEIVDTKPEGIVARARHQDHQVTVTIARMKNDDIVVGESFQAEIGFDEILNWKTIDDFEDAASGIWQVEDGIHLLGRVQSVLDFGDGKTIVDVYVQNGPEFFTVDVEGMADANLDSNDGLEITVGKLYIYPNNK